MVSKRKSQQEITEELYEAKRVYASTHDCIEAGCTVAPDGVVLLKDEQGKLTNPEAAQRRGVFIPPVEED